jgi:hypothetical protein
VSPPTTAAALFLATGRFHDPQYAGQWELPDVQAQFEAVVDLLIRGLRARD